MCSIPAFQRSYQRGRTGVKARAVARYAAVYVLTAALGISLGGALAHRHNSAPVSADGAVSLGSVVPAANSKPVDPHTFTMSGGVTGLTPGRGVTLPVKVSNPNIQAIKVLTITATAADASKTCRAAGNVTLSTYDSTTPGAAQYIVPGNGSLTVPLTVQLVDAPARNQNACRGVTFPLSYVGSAMQWGN
jgi:hypothetical protein